PQPRFAKSARLPGNSHLQHQHVLHTPPRVRPPQFQQALRQPPGRRIVAPIRYSSVLTSMPGSHKIWQLRQCLIPLMTTRHSKQMPMPHNGPRGSPLTEVLQAFPAKAIATATVVPDNTDTGDPFTVTVTWLDMRILLRHPRGQIRLDRNVRFCSG